MSNTLLIRPANIHQDVCLAPAKWLVGDDEECLLVRFNDVKLIPYQGFDKMCANFHKKKLR